MNKIISRNLRIDRQGEIKEYMNSKERITIALKGGIPDRVPIVNIFNMNYLVKESKNRGKAFNRFNQTNLKKIIDYNFFVFAYLCQLLLKKYLPILGRS